MFELSWVLWHDIDIEFIIQSLFVVFGLTGRGIARKANHLYMFHLGNSLSQNTPLWITNNVMGKIILLNISERLASLTTKLSSRVLFIQMLACSSYRSNFLWDLALPSLFSVI